MPSGFLLGLPSIALSGRSGAGKTTVAERLADVYGYSHRRSGALCRRICLDLFGEDSKEMLNAVTAAMQSIRRDAWISAALRGVGDDELVVFDSMRFAGDYERLKAAGFTLWRVEAPLGRRIVRLATREQRFDAAVDDRAASEVELDSHGFDYVINNPTDDLPTLWRHIEDGVEAMRAEAPARSARAGR